MSRKYPRRLVKGIAAILRQFHQLDARFMNATMALPGPATSSGSIGRFVAGQV
jgi:hypothetical protein